MQDQSSPDCTFPQLRKRPQPSALLTCVVGALAKYLMQKLKGGSICLGLRFKVASVRHGRKGVAVSMYSSESSAHISAKQKTDSWARSKTGFEAPPPKGLTISQNSATSWGPCAQHKSKEDRHRVLLPASHVWCLPVLSGCLALLWL